MSPRTARPTAREELIEVAARILAEEGPRALTVRRVAAEVGTSTMAIYTYFGKKDELARAVRVEGFARLARNLAAVPPMRDAVAELAAVGYAYCLTAIHNPNLYRSMFMEAHVDGDAAAAGTVAFERLQAAVERCIAAGRFRPADPLALARRFWSMTHGAVTLEIAGLISAEESIEDLVTMAAHLCAGYGDDPARAARSVRRGHRTMQERTAAPAAQQTHTA